MKFNEPNINNYFGFFELEQLQTFSFVPQGLKGEFMEMTYNLDGIPHRPLVRNDKYYVTLEPSSNFPF